VSLPDSDDEVFLAVALGAQADFLVTGNLRDFPARLRQGVAVVSPREFVDAFRRR
jgi:predicted nucleic acid-binding protein